MEFVRTHRNRIIIGIIVIVLGFVIVNRQRQRGAQKVESATVQRGNLKETLTISGAIDADQRVILRFQTAGRLSYVGVKKGDHVRKGQLVASLDQRSVKKSLQKELNTFAKTRLGLDQTRDDNKNSILTDTIQRTLQDSQYDVNNAVLDVELQQLAIEYANLTTPISGIVTVVTSPYAGINIVPTQAEFEIINPKTIYFTANADQTEVTQLHEGMEGDLTLDSYNDQIVHGKIDTIAYTPTAGETGTVYAIKFTPTLDKNPLYRIGMTGDATFTIKSKDNALYLPIKFVKEDVNKKYVLIMRRGKQVKQSVTTGIETDNNIEITSGLSLGDVVYD